MTRFEELERLLTGECGKYDTDCSRCPHQKECEEFSKLYQEEK